jgi:predicted DNA-binding protein (MmcQ/YjbR family)
MITMSFNILKNRIKQLPYINERPMFGYECFSANGKFFVGFSKKNKHAVIVRLSKEEQQKAVKNKGIKPFSHGASAGWIEINLKYVNNTNAFKWIRKGYDNALLLAKS